MVKKVFVLSLFLLVILIHVSPSLAASSDYYKSDAPQTRDPWRWPFSQDSIWNRPIGSSAQYTPARLQLAHHIGCDLEYIIRVDGPATMQKVYSPSGWEKRWPGDRIIGQCLVPDDLIIPDADPPSTPNCCLALLMPDGRTIRQLEPACRPKPGSHIVGWLWPDQDIYGPGAGGSHGGSSLSTIGGSIRVGELTGDKPIRHALKINLWAKKYLHYSESVKGFRWPATTADSYAAKGYGGSDPKLVMGSLLAIRPEVDIESLQLQTAPARKIFHALQDFGAYIPDDSAWDCHDLCTEVGVPEEVKTKYGLDMISYDGPWHDDMNKLIALLHVVDNNAPDNIGGGGSPRAPLAPPFKEQKQQQTPLRIMPLGDSMTYASDPGYRGYLYQMLVKKGYAVDFVGTSNDAPSNGGDPDHEGHGGFTIGPGPSKADEWTDGKGNIFVNIEHYLTCKPDVILLLIGTNDFFNIGDLQTDYDPNIHAPKRLADLIDRIQTISPDVKILVASILPVQWDANFAEPFNEEIPSIAKSRTNVFFVDMNKKAGFKEGDWQADKLHPTQRGYRKIAKVWYSALTKLTDIPSTKKSEPDGSL